MMRACSVPAQRCARYMPSMIHQPFFYTAPLPGDDPDDSGQEEAMEEGGAPVMPAAIAAQHRCVLVHWQTGLLSGCSCVGGWQWGVLFRSSPCCGVLYTLGN